MSDANAQEQILSLKKTKHQFSHPMVSIMIWLPCIQFDMLWHCVGLCFYHLQSVSARRPHPLSAAFE